MQPNFTTGKHGNYQIKISAMFIIIAHIIRFTKHFQHSLFGILRELCIQLIKLSFRIRQPQKMDSSRHIPPSFLVKIYIIYLTTGLTDASPHRTFINRNASVFCSKIDKSILYLYRIMSGGCNRGNPWKLCSCTIICFTRTKNKHWHNH